MTFEKLNTIEPQSPKRKMVKKGNSKTDTYSPNQGRRTLVQKEQADLEGHTAKLPANLTAKSIQQRKVKVDQKRK